MRPPGPRYYQELRPQKKWPNCLIIEWSVFWFVCFYFCLDTLREREKMREKEKQQKGEKQFMNVDTVQSNRQNTNLQVGARKGYLRTNVILLKLCRNAGHFSILLYQIITTSILCAKVQRTVWREGSERAVLR